jgi:radical SAM superfamily enzyme YgiQ (UPF0313 family)
MRVILINPPTIDGVKFVREGRCEQRASSFQYVMVPISLPSIAAVLRQAGHDVQIVDCIADNLGTDELLDALDRFKPNLAILDVSTPTIHNDLAISSLIGQKNQGCHVSAIGTHVTALPAETLKDSPLDSVIRGEPEMTSLELADALERHTDLAGIAGLAFKRETEIVLNPERPFIEDLDSLPFPARDLLNNEKYTMPVSNRPYTLLVSSRGCTGQCIFCTGRLYYGQKLRLRSAANICDELEEITGKFNIKDVTMWSDTFTLNRDFVVSVCEEILRRVIKVNWMANSRVDRVDLDLLKLMRRSGCSMISFGIESAVPEILKKCRKGTNPVQIENAIKWSREAGLETIAHVILGLPGETAETIRETDRFIRRINPDYVQYYGAIPFPGTEFYEMAQDNKWLTTNDWSCFEINQTIVGYPGLPAPDLDRARRRAFRSFYFRPGYLVKRLARLKTWREWSNLPKQGWGFLREWVWKAK